MVTVRLYIVQPKSELWGGYDTYDSFICAAETESEACRIHPSGVPMAHADTLYSSTWPDDPEDVHAVEIGIAYQGCPSGIVMLASFNAG